MKDFEVYLIISSLMMIMFMLLSIRRRAILERQKIALASVVSAHNSPTSPSSPSKCNKVKIINNLPVKNKCTGGCKNKCSGGCRRKHILPCGCINKCTGECRRKQKLPCGCINKCSGECRRKHILPCGCIGRCNRKCKKWRRIFRKMHKKKSDCGCDKPKRKSVMHVTSPSPASILSVLSSISSASSPSSPVSPTSPTIIIRRRRRRPRRRLVLKPRIRVRSPPRRRVRSPSRRRPCKRVKSLPRRRVRSLPKVISTEVNDTPTIFIKANNNKYVKVDKSEPVMELDFRDPFKLARNDSNVTQEEINKKNHMKIAKVFGTKTDTSVRTPISSVESPTPSTARTPSTTASRTPSTTASPTPSTVESPVASTVVSPTASTVTSTTGRKVAETISTTRSDVMKKEDFRKGKNCNKPNYGLDASPVSYIRKRGSVGLRSCSKNTLSRKMGKPNLGHISDDDSGILNNTDDFEDKKFDPYYLGRFKNLNPHLRFRNMAAKFTDRYSKEHLKKVVVKKAFESDLKDPYAKVPKELRDLPNSVSMQISDNSTNTQFEKDAFDSKYLDAYKLY